MNLQDQIATEQAEAQERLDLLKTEKDDAVEELEESLDSVAKLKEEQTNFQTLTKAIQVCRCVSFSGKLT